MKSSLHKWDELCQHDKSVEMGILTTTSRSTRAERICNPIHQATDLLANATEQPTETKHVTILHFFYGSSMCCFLKMVHLQHKRLKFSM